MEAAYTQGRQCIFERMQAIAPEQKVDLDALLSEVATLSPPVLQARLRQQLHRLLIPANWQDITAAALAAVESKLLSQVTPA